MRRQLIALLCLFNLCNVCHASSLVDAQGTLTVNVVEPEFGISTSTVVLCVGTFVHVNGNFPDSGIVPCSEIKKIVVNGTEIEDEVDLSEVKKTEFANIKSTKIVLRAGNDSAIGSAANDVMNGGSGNDTLEGNSGKDRLNGGSGNDVVKGGSGNDILLGGSGNDVLRGGPGSDLLDGGSGFNNVSQ